MSGSPRRADEPVAELKLVSDVTCTYCSCLCDDIEVGVRDNRIVAAHNACQLAQAWFFQPTTESRPSCLVDGRPATVEAGIERAAALLTAARNPLVYGLDRASCETQQLAVAIADRLGGVIDSPASFQHGLSGLTFRGVGEVTATWGEIANRSDLVVFWGANPAVDQPRHLSRYSLSPVGRFVPQGRAGRTFVVVDGGQTQTAEAADCFLQIEPGSDFEAIWTLRAVLQGIALDAAAVARQTGVPLDEWQKLAERMQRAQYGVVFFGPGLGQSPGQEVKVAALMALVRDLNASARFVACALRGRGNGAGAENVVTWQTGYPFAVDLTRGFPRFGGGEFNAADMLAAGEADAALIVASDPLVDLPATARRGLAAIPYVAIDSQNTATLAGAAVAFTSAIPGIEVGGTVHRADELPLRLRPVCRSVHPSDLQILAQLEQRIQLIQADNPT